MLSRIYIKHTNRITGEIQIYELSATNNEEYSMNSQATQSRVQDSGSYSDHQVRDNKVIRFGGLLSSVSSIFKQGEPEFQFKQNKVKDEEDFISGLEAIRDSGSLVTAVFGKSGRVRSNCSLKSISFSRNSENQNAYKVSITMEQLQIPGPATVSYEYSSITVNDKFTGKTTKLDGPTSLVYMERDLELRDQQSSAVNYLKERGLLDSYLDTSIDTRFQAYYENLSE